MLIASRIEMNTFLIKDVVSTNGGYFYGGEKVDILKHTKVNEHKDWMGS